MSEPRQDRTSSHLLQQASLHQELAALFSTLGKTAQALEHLQDAVTIYRELAAGEKDFLPQLATCLTDLSNVLSDLGRRKEALAATEEAVGFYRRLAEANPQAFLPNLTRGLNNLGLRLSALGRRKEALAAHEEAVRLLLPFFRALPAVFGDWMQTFLHNYLDACRTARRRPDKALVREVRWLLVA